MLLEPIMKLEITTPEENLGDFISDLQQRRAMITHTQPPRPQRGDRSRGATGQPVRLFQRHAGAEPGPGHGHDGTRRLWPGPARCDAMVHVRIGKPRHCDLVGFFGAVKLARMVKLCSFRPVLARSALLSQLAAGEVMGKQMRDGRGTGVSGVCRSRNSRSGPLTPPEKRFNIRGLPIYRNGQFKHITGLPHRGFV